MSMGMLEFQFCFCFLIETFQVLIHHTKFKRSPFRERILTRINDLNWSFNRLNSAAMSLWKREVVWLHCKPKAFSNVDEIEPSNSHSSGALVCVGSVGSRSIRTSPGPVFCWPCHRSPLYISICFSLHLTSRPTDFLISFLYYGS